MSSSPLHDLLDLTGRVAIVTGGSRGLGLQIAEAFGEFGAQVVLVARKAAELETAVATLKAQGTEASAFACDLSHAEGVATLCDWVANRYSRVDILVNNAGTSWGAPTVDHPLEGWQKVMAINLTGIFLLTQAVAKRWMVPAQRGRIVNVASIEGLRGHHPDLVGTIGYNTAKGGLINFTRALAAEWGPLGITVNALAPGYFPSKLTAATLGQHEAQLVAHTPRGRLGGPHDLKGAALLFASDAGAHVNGQILAIDGGFTAI
ncbi:SDR family oxidoreductase [Bosea sp. PAMC 26642]|uniref:SDR family oxidoreductase n=1 Tax=Bosea sp. (strain PAMC 26642) TaxID=1792307 RepID=UPI00076FE7CE|nr:SDR family oxidoreductase [Bosea sp. PAMC 26642]AMJ61476.1 gluconate 5-dehydrogenase [Bosea sp. PAMC 26642]